MNKQETLEEAAENHVNYKGGFYSTEQLQSINDFKAGYKCLQEKFCDSEFLQRIRASKSDAEARRIIRTI